MQLLTPNLPIFIYSVWFNWLSKKVASTTLYLFSCLLALFWSCAISAASFSIFGFWELESWRETGKAFFHDLEPDQTRIQKRCDPSMAIDRNPKIVKWAAVDKKMASGARKLWS